MSKTWKVLVYIAADNTLYDDAQISLRQMADASRFSDFEVIVQFDGPGLDSASRYRCAGGAKRLIWEAPDNYTTDRGTRLQDFLNCADSIPTADDRIFLILWGHGAGLDHVYLYSDSTNKDGRAPVSQSALNDGHSEDSDGASTNGSNSLNATQSIQFDLLNSDDTHANRYLKDIQLVELLENFTRRIGRKIDLMGLDACLMGMVEICHELSECVSLLIASDEEIPKESWPYDLILGDLATFPGMDVTSLSPVIVSRFIERYSAGRAHGRTSLSAYNLSGSQALASAMKGFVDGLVGVIDDGVARRKILSARDNSRTPDIIDYVDLSVFCRAIAESFDDRSSICHRASEVLYLLANLPYVLYHRSTGKNGAIDPLGLAIYFPQRIPPTSEEIHQAVGANERLRLYYPLNRTEDGQALRTSTASRAAPELEQSLQIGAKTVGEPTKTVGEPTKTVGEPTKTVGEPTKHIGRLRRRFADGQVIPRQLIGSEVVWDLYLQFKFNQITGWSTLLEKALVTKDASSR